MLRDRGKTAGGAAEFGAAAIPQHLARPSPEEPRAWQFSMPDAMRTVIRWGCRCLSASRNCRTPSISSAPDIMRRIGPICCKESGKIYCHSDFVPDLDELPGDIEDEEKYLRIPDQRDLDLGKPLVLDFAREFLPDDFDTVRDIFRKRGAYAKFKTSGGAKRRPRSMVRLPGESRGAGLEGVVRRQRDRGRRLTSARELP